MPPIDLSEVVFRAWMEGEEPEDPGIGVGSSASGGSMITLDGIKFRPWELGENPPDPDPFP